MKIHFLSARALLPLAILTATVPALNADDIIKANNTTTLNATTSWVGGVVPGPGDVAVWNSTVTANRLAALGANATWQGIRVTNAGGTQSNISATTGTVLTLGSGGIDMSAATIDFRIDNPINFSTDQAITIASGRELEFRNTTGNNTGTSILTLGGEGAFGSRPAR